MGDPTIPEGGVDADELDDDEPGEARPRGLAGLLGLLDSSARRGQDLVSEVAKVSKDELVRVISAEVRGFLDKMDVADLAQQIVAGLKVEVHTEIRFSRDEEGRAQPEVVRHEAKIGSAPAERPERRRTS